MHSKIVVLAGLSLAATIGSHAAATRIAYVDTFAIGRGNAFTATADNPSAVFYNAAGLTQLEGTEVKGNLYAFSAEYEYSGPFGSASSDDSYQAVPSFFAAHKFKDQPIAIGFGVYAPFALGIDWGPTAPFAPIAYKAELEYAKYHAVIAWQVTDTLSVGIGPSYDDAELTLKSTGPLGSFKGDDTTAGYSASILWQPAKEHSFGINYQAPSTMNFEGTSTVFGSAEARMEFPESIVFGYSWRPNEQWNIEFNLDWTNWDRVNDLKISSSVAPDVIVALNWESAFIWEVGATRYFDNGWYASAGYTFVENAVPDTEFTPIVPDADRHFFHIGVGREYDNFSWQFAYQFTYAEDRSVTGNAAPFGLPNGDYDLESHAFSFSVAYRF